MAFAGSSATHHRFTWEGWNQVGVRERGSKKFKEFVAGLPSKAPDTKRVAICHSHGGSVVLSAFLDRHIASSFDGLVSIGTPFLHVYRLGEVEPSILPPYSIVPAMLAWIVPAIVIWLAFGSPQLAVASFASTFG
jgi:alpha-beta hydrolase superfamily lysophospholipase